MACSAARLPLPRIQAISYLPRRKLRSNTLETPVSSTHQNASPTPLDTGCVQLSAQFEAAHAQVPLIPPGSGDFHAAFPLPDGSGTVAVLLGDVAGHGPAAAAQAAALQEAIAGCLAEGLPPSEALGFVNAAAEMDPKFKGFATVFAATVTPETGHLVYASGGHEPALIATPKASSPAASGSTVVELNGTGPPLGVLGADQVAYDQMETTLAPGASLLLYSDGVTETRRDKDFLGFDRLRHWMTRFAAAPPARLVRQLLGKVYAFAGSRSSLRDDLVLLILRRR